MATAPERFDLVVIGGGMAGLPLANKAAYKGLRVALVEKELLGGTCLNRGCIPTKTMIASARVAQVIRRASDFGVRAGAPEVDLPAIVERKDRVVEEIRQGAYRRVEANDNLSLIEAEATLQGGREVRVGERLLAAERIVINVGARPAVPSIRGLDGVPYLTNRELLELRELPGSLVVVGGGYIGVEFAQMFARFGSRVTVIQRADRLLPSEEPELGEALAEILVDEGLEVRTGAEAVAIAHAAGGVSVAFRGPGGEGRAQGDALLVAAGRSPNTGGLAPGAAGIETDDDGFIRVDERFRTSAEGIFAIGDVTGRPMFTHSARDDAELLYRILVKEDPEATREGRVVPHAVFTDPEVASVGLTEAEAEERGYEVSVGLQEFAGVARARAMGETAGLIKLIGDRTSGRLLGGHILGPAAGELIHEIALAMTLGAGADALARALHVHPTLSEGVNAAAGGVHRPAG